MISSGLRVENPSDDPTAVTGIMRSSSALRALEQYKENLASAGSRLAVENDVLDQLTDILSRAKELGISQAGDIATTASRSAVREEVEGLRDFVIELGNTRWIGSFLFAGDYADTKPFDAAGPDPTRPPTGTHKVEGGAGAFYAVNHSGQEIFVDTGILDALDNLATALGSDSGADIRTSISDLDAAFADVQELIGELGARMHQVDTAVANAEALEGNLQTFRSDLQDADLEEVVSKLVGRQVSYEAAMMTNARILQSTLTDYLR
jgi:flagellar hook-associated protein 3 FlgL